MTEFPKVRVKKCYLSKGEDAATALAQEIGGITSGKLARWFREWSGAETPARKAPASDVPEERDDADPVEVGRGITMKQLSKSDAAYHRVWHEGRELLDAGREERLKRKAAERAEKKAARKAKKPKPVLDEWELTKKEAKKQGVDPYDLAKEKENARHKPPKAGASPDKGRRKGRVGKR